METSLSTAVHFLPPAHPRNDYIDTSCTFLIKGFPLPSPGFIDEEFDLTSTSLSTSSEDSPRKCSASSPDGGAFKRNSCSPNFYISNNHFSFEVSPCCDVKKKNLERETDFVKALSIEQNNTPLNTVNHCHSPYIGSSQFLDNNYVYNENDTPFTEPKSVQSQTSHSLVSLFNRSSAKLLAAFPSQVVKTLSPAPQPNSYSNTGSKATNTLFELKNIQHTNLHSLTDSRTVTFSSPQHVNKIVTSPPLNHSTHARSVSHILTQPASLDEKSPLFVKPHDVKLVNPKLQGSYEKTPPTAVLKLDSRRRLDENTIKCSLNESFESCCNRQNSARFTSQCDVLHGVPCTTTHSALLSLSNPANKNLELNCNVEISDKNKCGIHEPPSKLSQNIGEQETHWSSNTSSFVPHLPKMKGNSDAFINANTGDFKIYQNCSRFFPKDAENSKSNKEGTLIKHLVTSHDHNDSLPLKVTVTAPTDLPFVNLKIPPLLSHSGFYPVDLTRIEPSIQEPAPLPAGNSKNRRLMFTKRPSWISVGKRLLASPPINETEELHETKHEVILQTTELDNHSCTETVPTEKHNSLEQWNHSPETESHHSNIASPRVIDVTLHRKIKVSPAKDTSTAETSNDHVNKETDKCNKNVSALPISLRYKNPTKSIHCKKKRNTYAVLTSVSSCQVASASSLWNCFESKCLSQDQRKINNTVQTNLPLDSLHIQETQQDSVKETFVEKSIHQSPCENFFETTPKSLGNRDASKNVNFFENGRYSEPIKESYNSTQVNLLDQVKNHNVPENVSGKRKETQQPIPTSPGILPTPRPIPRIQGKKKSKNQTKSNNNGEKDTSNFSNILLSKHNHGSIEISNNPDYRLDLVPVSPEPFVSLCDLPYDNTLKNNSDKPCNSKEQNIRLSLRSFGCQAVTYSKKDLSNKTKFCKRTITTRKKKFSLENSVLTCKDPLVYFPLNQLPKEYINRNRQSLEISSKTKPTVKTLNYCNISQSRPKRIRQRPLRWWLLEHVEYNRPVGSECPVPIGVHRRPQETFVKLAKNTKKVRLTIGDGQERITDVAEHDKKTVVLNESLDTKNKKKKGLNKRALCQSPKEQQSIANQPLWDPIVDQVAPEEHSKIVMRDSEILTKDFKKKVMSPKQSQGGSIPAPQSASKLCDWCVDIKLIEYDSLEFVKIESNSGSFHVAIVLETPFYSVCELMLYPGQSKGVDVTISTLLGHVVMVEDTLDSNIESSQPCSGNCLLQIGNQACSMPWQKACATAKEMSNSLSEKKKKKNSQAISDSEFVLKSLSEEGLSNSSEINSVRHICLLLSRGHHFHIPAETQYNFTNISKTHPLVLSLTVCRKLNSSSG